MRKKLVFLIISSAILLLTTCHNECSIDKKFSYEFKNCILLVHKLNNEKVASDIKVRASTYECLSALTGYVGHVDKANEPHYFYPYSDTIDYVKTDIEEWCKWYELNKCKMTIAKADSLIQKHSIEYGVDNLHWPPPEKEVVRYIN
jgi:hypothetical protein